MACGALACLFALTMAGFTLLRAAGLRQGWYTWLATTFNAFRTLLMYLEVKLNGFLRVQYDAASNICPALGALQGNVEVASTRRRFDSCIAEVSRVFERHASPHTRFLYESKSYFVFDSFTALA